MVTKEEMKQLLIQMADYLKTLGLTNEEILGVVNIANFEAIINGTYKN